MADSNESQGLKIAVAAFMTLSVILAVTSYFLYAQVAQTQARLEVEQVARQTAKKMASVALAQYDAMRISVGTRSEEFEVAKKEISANFKRVDGRLNNLMSAVNTAVETAQQNGAHGPELEDAKLKVQRAFASYRSEPNKNYISALERLTELVESLAFLTTQLSHNDVGGRRSLEGTTSAAKGQKDPGPSTKD